MSSKRGHPLIDVAVGFAADEAGQGLAYAKLTVDGNQKLLRVPFRVRRYPSLLEREVSYAATTAVVTRLADLGCRRLKIEVPDSRLVEDAQAHSELPLPLALEYVRLGCALNRFAEYYVQAGGAVAQDLTARARAEVALHVAA